jgi:hypothetical protein
VYMCTAFSKAVIMKNALSNAPCVSAYNLIRQQNGTR